MQPYSNVLLIIVELTLVVYAEAQRWKSFRLLSFVLKEDRLGSAIVAVELEN